MQEKINISHENMEELIEKLQIDSEIPKTALKNIIKIDNHNNLSDLFYKYFFVSNDKIEELVQKLYRSFDDGCQFKIVHGYSKNGKTTFINYLKYLHEKGELPKSEYYDHIKLIPFDFEKAKPGGLIKKVQTFYHKTFFCFDIEERIKINEEINQFCLFLKKFLYKLNKENQESQYEIIRNTFLQIAELFDEYIKDTQGGNTEQYFKVTREFEQRIENTIDDKNCGKYFTFIVFFELFKQRELILSGKKHKFVFTLDNIDDYLKNKDISFFQHPQIYLSTLLHELSHNPYISVIFIKCLQETFSCKTKINNVKFNFKNHVAFIYVFRTANFLVFANLIQQQLKKASTTGERHFASLLLDKEYIHFRSVGNTSEILKLRLDRFVEIAKYLNMKLPAGYTFLKELADSFDSKEKPLDDRNIRRIYNLWNGDKSALWESIIKNWEKLNTNYFNNEKFLKFLYTSDLNRIFKNVEFRDSLIKSELNHNFCLQKFKDFIKHLNLNDKFDFEKFVKTFNESDLKNDFNIDKFYDFLCTNDFNQDSFKYLLRGVYVNFFLYLLNDNIIVKDYLLEHAINSFSETNSKIKKKNINRILSCLIINKTLKSGKPTCLRQIDKKGVGLYDLLFEIEEFINTVNSKSNNNKIYDFDEVVTYFKDLCNIKIDHFGQLFSIYKDQITTDENETYTSTYYDLNTEIDIYKSKKHDSKTELNNVRIYNNNNAAYISASLLTNYELHSYLSNKNNDDGKLPLPLLFELYKTVNGTAAKIMEFKFYETIERVFKHTKKLIENMIDFYCDCLILAYPPDDFLKSDLFFVKDKDEKADFQFRLIISRHITYLELFRQVILKYSDSIIDLNDDEKRNINVYLVNVIVRYCKLYCNSYNRIKEKADVENNVLKYSYNTYNTFISIGNRIIKEDNYNYETFENLLNKVVMT